MKPTTDVFCAKTEFLLENDLAGAFYDLHPMAKGHLLVIPKSHYPTFFDTPVGVQRAMIDLLNEAKRYLDQQFQPRGYQIFSHVGPAAGQTILHAHLHLVPVY
ncbi:HIT family protein [Lactiplantibacillus carotarum]|uniref:HIT family protein n=1 Tax=Lactiplantibacillus carotarum TaxID=2993456 RepID=UPI00298EEB12|nr:HIT family protein [Lactiplantibacillus carotarum]